MGTQDVYCIHDVKSCTLSMMVIVIVMIFDDFLKHPGYVESYYVLFQHSPLIIQILELLLKGGANNKL